MPSNKKFRSSGEEVSAANEQLEQFKDSLKDEAEHVIRDLFPAKILEINALISSKQFELQRIPEFDVDCGIPVPDVIPASELNCVGNNMSTATHGDDSVVMGTKVYGFTNGMVNSNRKITELVEIVKPIVREAVEYVNKIKIWIMFLIPRIEDGNNFGVSIQEETLAEVRTVEAEAASFLDQISRYYLTRGKIVAKVAKYPHVEDYRRSIVDIDQKEYWNLRLVLMELRNHYGSLHDMIMKNLEKIKIPRSSNVEHLY